MDVVENEIIKELNWKERIIVKLFAKTFEKVYNKCRIKIVNSIINGWCLLVQNLSIILGKFRKTKKDIVNKNDCKVLKTGRSSTK